MGTDARVERLVSMSRAVLDRLDRGEKLSLVLPQARAVAELHGNRPHGHWLDCEIYGMVDVPFAKQPRKDEDEKAGVYLFFQLRRAADVRNITVDGVMRDWSKDKGFPDRSLVVHHSVSHLERSAEEHRPPRSTDEWRPARDQDLQLDLLASEHQRVLDGVRAYLYQYINSIWSWGLQEQENRALLGPDYRIVVESLDVLETDVGQVLLASLTSVNRTNPADWSLSALACRNVILSLGRMLFPTRSGTHDCAMLGKSLDLGGEKELNCLTAFIDVHWQEADGEAADELKALAELARRIHGKGSAGKRGSELRHAEAQQLVVDTFHLVSRLKDITGLEPLDGAAP
jgi:hypothetical protein